jgi:serine/threonine-protein kinase RsbW
MQADKNMAPVLATETVRFHIKSEHCAVRDGLRQVLSAEPLAGLIDDDRGTAEIVLAEVLNNVVEHAYAAGTGLILLSLRLGDGWLHCEVEDEGAAMPGCEPPAGRAPDPADLPEGGFGWNLIRVLCSGLRYERQDGMNRLSFSLPAEQSAA